MAKAKAVDNGRVLVSVSADETPGEFLARRAVSVRAASARNAARQRAKSGKACPSCGKPLLPENTTGFCRGCRPKPHKKKVPCSVCGAPRWPSRTRGDAGRCRGCYAASRVAVVPVLGRPCRHCGVRLQTVCRGRGLCNRCWFDRDVRALYPSLTPLSPKVLTCAGPPAEPTDAPPGSGCKMAVLAARAARGESLHHSADNGRERLYGPPAASATRAVRYHQRGA